MGRRPKEVPVEGRHEGDIVVCDLCGQSVNRSVSKSSYFIHFKGDQDRKPGQAKQTVTPRRQTLSQRRNAA
jgi:hypothetical protein